ncbi:MAG: AbrB/MazE/SpoVT family DNA-binding domain-containing protein [Steroidobacteraceae bacterium]|nr:AbrB/MazE/SpoVT family DNA-binding domain-containing protein [Steroidobacteraceae bacterium]
MKARRSARLFRNGRNQAVRIPREFELPGEEVLIHRDGSRLILEPAPRRSLGALLASWEPLESGLESISDPPPEPVKL